MGFKYSITLSSFRNIEPIEHTLVRLRKQGYDAVEMFGEPDEINLRDFRDKIRSFDFNVCGVTGMWGKISVGSSKRKLLSQDPSLVSHVEDYVKKCIEMCEYLGGNEINVCLFADDNHVLFDANHNVIPENIKQSTIKRIIPILQSLTKYASDHNVVLLIEPLNRYSTPYCTNAKDAIFIAQLVNQSNLGILLDTFHMNIEESSFEEAIMESRDFLRHTHFAENNRSMPGYGHLDFESILKTLHKIGYSGYISFEPNLTVDDYELTTQKGLKFIKRLENLISQRG